MKKILYLLLLCTLFAISCNDDELNGIKEGFDVPKTESTDQYEITYQYNEDVIVLDEFSAGCIEKVIADTIIYFSLDLPENIIPEVNDIISSTIYDKLPYGLGNRVLSFEEEAGAYKCVTTPAPLDEIFKELDIKAVIQLLDTTSSGFYDDEGNYWETTFSESSETKVSIGSPNVLTINLGNYSSETGAKFYANGAFTLGLIATIDFSLLGGRSECSLEANAGMSGEVGAKSSWKGYKKILKKENLITQVVAIGPIILRPYVDIELGLQGGIEGNVNVGFSKQFGIKAGVRDGSPFWENTTQSANTNFVDNISVNAKGNLGLVCAFDFGAGLYTKNIALGIEPSISAGFSTELELNNPNIFREGPELNLEITADTDVFFFAQFFGKEFVKSQETLASIKLFSYSWPLLPTLVENSLNVEKRNSNGPLTFDAKYKLEGGLLGKFIDITPAFHVYRGGNEIYYLEGNKGIGADETNEFTFELKNLNHDISYTGKPCIMFMGNLYDEDGIPFSSTSPTAAITDIVQTSSEYGTFYHNGNEYDYEFKFYVNTEIRGSDNCKEWGVYDPNSDDIYNPNELKDGRITQYWTAWSTSGSATFSKTPYVILKETGSYKYFERHTHTLHYYSGYAAPGVCNNSIPFTDGAIVMQLDSVRYERY